MKDVRLVVLSGPSGAGKSTAVKAVEDLGYYCVDNMPVTLLPRFMELLAQSGEILKVAAVIDIREGEFLKDFTPVYKELKENYHIEILYLEASDESIVRRFSETRRKHPLATSETPLEAVKRERELLKELKNSADKIIDTTYFNVHQLREVIKNYFSGAVARERMALNFISFGFKYGVPTEADIVMDVRFLPNPYFIESLKWQDGQNSEVRDFLMSREETLDFIRRFKDFLDYLVPLYWKEGKSYLTVAIGCTGGKHRSVVVTEEIASLVSYATAVVRKRHRDIDKS